MAMNPRLLVPRATAHPEAQSWATRAAANGGIVDTLSLAAASAFCQAIDQGGIRAKLAYVNLLIGGNLNAALVPLYRSFSLGGTTYGNATATNTNFTSANYTRTGGLNVSAAGARHIDFDDVTSWTSSVFDLHYGCGVVNATAGAPQTLLIQPNVGDNSNRLFSDIVNGGYRGFIGGGALNGSSISSTLAGRFITSRSSQTSLTSFRNASAGSTVTSSVSDIDPSAAPWGLGTLNPAATTSGHSFHYFHVGTALTSGQVAILDAALSNYLAIIGRT